MASDFEITITQTIPTSVFKGHDAGVTAILPLPTPNRSGALGDLLLTGSYDDHVRVYTTYDGRQNAPSTAGKALAQLKIGGGVWRLKFLDTPEQMSAGREGVKFKVLASCMHAGARILEVKMDTSQEGGWSIEILGSVTVHDSMCYGCDVQPSPDSNDDMNKERLCVSTSFYDRLVCVWKFDPNAV